jgi:CarD family transcriptional regulator
MRHDCGVPGHSRGAAKRSGTRADFQVDEAGAIDQARQGMKASGATQKTQGAAESANAKAEAAKPAAAKPALKKPASTKPVLTDPGPEKATAPKPAKAAPAPAAMPASAKPAMPERPAPKKPAAAKPAAEKPAAEKPGAEKQGAGKQGAGVSAPQAPAPTKAVQEKPRPAAQSVATPPPAAAEPAASPAVAAVPAPSAPIPPRPMGAHTNGRPPVISRASNKDESFAEGDYVVYPTHGVGKVEKIAREEIAGHHLELIHITFEENRMTLRVPVSKARSAGLRKLSTRKMFDEALAVLKGRARVKRTMWSRRAQEYEAKINSGDPQAIAEVVRDLHRNAGQPDQSFSERQIYEAAMDRLAAELGALDQTDKMTALVKLGNFLKTL